jgi:hypothetical protein
MSDHQLRDVAVKVTRGEDPKIAVTIVFTEMTRRWRRGGGVALCLWFCTLFADGSS